MWIVYPGKVACRLAEKVQVIPLKERPPLVHGSRPFCSAVQAWRAFGQDQAGDTLHDSITMAKDCAHRERFIQHYYETYCDPELPPGWMIFEMLSLGTLSQIYAH
jgi:hypothetical protein